MGKRKIEDTTDSNTPLAASKEFTSLISKYSYSPASIDDVATKSSSPVVTPPETPKKRKQNSVRVSPGGGRNPGYAPPSAYAHLPTPDLDRLAHNLILLFIGLNPGSPNLASI